MRVPVPRNRLVALTLVGALMTAVVAVGLASPGLLPGIDGAATAQSSTPNGNTGAGAATPSSSVTRSESNSRAASIERDGEIHVGAEGEIRPGQSVVLVATRGGAPVGGALVEVDGRDVGRTQADGRIRVPVRGDEFEVRIESENARGRLEVEWDE